MRTTRAAVVMSVAVVVVGAVAVGGAVERLLALRVEATPVREAAGETLMKLAVQVAPEDRTRLGRDAWLRVELMRNDAAVDRLARPVEVGDDGGATIEVAWPPGEYRMRVDIESADGEHTGFWVMDLEVPPMTPPEPPSDPPAEPPPAAPAPAQEESAEVQDEPQPEEAVRDEAPVVIAPVEAPEAVPGPQPEPAPESVPQGGELSPPAPAVNPAPDPDPVRPPEPSDPPSAVWTGPAAGELAVTVAATRDDRPVLSLGAVDLRLTAAGGRREITAVDGGASVPLQLAVVVALSAEIEAELPRIGRALSRAAARGSDAAGGLILVSGAGAAPRRLEWAEAAVRLPEILAEADLVSEPDLVGMVSEALETIAGRPGRRFVVVVTDGRDEASRSDWRRLEQAAASATAPILAVGLWSPDFDRRTRDRLSDVADAAGGSVFYVQGVDRLQQTLERYGDLVSASVLVRFAAPGGTDDGVAIGLEAMSPGVTLLAPPVAR